METKRKFKLDIELLMILIFTALVVFVSFNLLSPIVDFILSVLNFSAFTMILENAFIRRPEYQKYYVIIFIIVIFSLIYLIVKIKNKNDEI